MPNLPEIDVVEIQTATKYSKNAKLKHTTHSYEIVDNGLYDTGIHYPFDSRSWICSTYFQDSDSLFMGGARITSPGVTHYFNTSGSIYGEGQNVTIIGKEIMYGFPYKVYYQTGTTSNPTISNTYNAILVHTMQEFQPFYFNIQSWAYQWDFYNNSILNYNSVYDLPKKHIYYDRNIPSGESSYQINYYGNCLPYEPLIDPNTNNYVYTTGGSIYLPDYIYYLKYGIDFAGSATFSELNMDLGDTKLYKFTNSNERANLHFGMNYQLHNIKQKTFGNIKYHCSELYASLCSDSGYSDYVQVDFDYRFLPTYAGEYGKELASHPTFGSAMGRDMCWFLRDYNRFLQKYNQDGTTIRPASLDHYYASNGETYLPTIEVTSLEDMVLYQGYYYAPIDINKCEEICSHIENINSTASNDVVLLPRTECPDSYYQQFPTDKFYSERDVTMLRTDTESSLVDFL